MQLPQLDTNYTPDVKVDVGNALLRGKQLQHADLSNALLSQNIEDAKSKRGKTSLDEIKEKLKIGRDALAAVDVDNLGPDDYVRMRKWAMETLGANPNDLPDPSVFYMPDESGTQKKFDKTKFNSWRKTAISTAETMLKGPKEGDKITYHDGKNEVTRVLKDGKWQEFTSPKWAPEKSKLLTKEEEAQEIRIAHAKREPRDVETWGGEETRSDGTTIQKSNRGKINTIKTKEMTDSEKRQRIKDLADAEEKIESNKDKKEAAGRVSQYNALSDKDEYVWKPGKLYGGEWVKQQKGGKQAAAGSLDETTARKILQEAGRDKNKARQIAKQRGYKF